jgi:hypothetical protein
VPTHQRNIAPSRRLLAAAGLLASLVSSPAISAAGPAWTATVKPDPETQQTRCVLTSESQTSGDGYDTTPVTLVFNGASLAVLTESELDASFSDLQLAVDKNPPFHIDKITRKKNLVFDQNVAELAQQMRKGRQVTVSLRFWPTWPATQSFPVHFSLSGFAKAHDSLSQNCQFVTERPAAR